MNRAVVERLVCAQFGTISPPDARGWRGVLAVGDEHEEDKEEAFVFCPACAEREFDD